MSQLRRVPDAGARCTHVNRCTSDVMLPLILAGGILLFISVFSVAFVWNMRMIGNRSGRMKPIWMPGRGVSSRPARLKQRRG